MNGRDDLHLGNAGGGLGGTTPDDLTVVGLGVGNAVKLLLGLLLGAVHGAEEAHHGETHILAHGEVGDDTVVVTDLAVPRQWVGAEESEAAANLLLVEVLVNGVGGAWGTEAEVAELAATAVEQGVVPVVDVSIVRTSVAGGTTEARLGEGLLDHAGGAQGGVAHIVAADTGNVVLVTNVVVASAGAPAQEVVAAVGAISTALANGRSAGEAQPGKHAVIHAQHGLAVLGGTSGPLGDLTSRGGAGRMGLASSSNSGTH